MFKKRETLAGMWHSLGGSWLWQCFPSRAKVTILALHRIGPRLRSAHTGLNSTLVDMPNGDFIQLVRWLSTYTNPISVKELESWFLTGRPLPPRASLITFDYGYKDNLDAAEIMAHYDVPGVFFLAPQMIAHRTLGWWEQVHYAIWNTKQKECEYGGRHYWLPAEQAELYRDVGEAMKSAPNALTLRQVHTLINDLRAPVPEEVVERNLMTKEDVDYVSQTLGMAVGVHGMPHQTWGALTPSQQQSELEHAKDLLEDWSCSAVISLAYPALNRTQIGNMSKLAAEQAGFSLGMTLVPGHVHSKSVDRYELPRISSQGNWQLDCATLAHPGIFQTPATPGS